jgi:hypothetical protein
MNWTRFVLIVIGSGVVSSLTDWFFAGDWLHRRYTYPGCTVGSACSLFQKNSPEIRGCEFSENLEPSEFV